MKKKTILFHSLWKFIKYENLFSPNRRVPYWQRFAIIFIAGSFLMVNSSVIKAQPVEKKITFELKNQPLEKGLQLLEQLSG
ncbi:MAG: hypothetical protein VB054_03695, partial [Petrimonas sp.]|nr:hypothetical protein [Petrimonas sp.]